MGSTSEPWDAETVNSFGYDANGNLTSQSGKLDDVAYEHRNLPTQFALASGDTVIANYNADGQRVLKELKGGAWKFYVMDGQQTLAVIDENGTTTENRDYYPFGLLMDERQYVQGAETTEKFSGKERDQQTGFDYFGARYYMPGLGRFLSTDRFADKYPSLSTYQYAANNPVSFIDVNGDSLVDMNGNIVGVTVKENKDGSFSANYNFAEGTSDEVKNKFQANGGRVVSAMAMTDEGRKQISNMNNAEHDIHINISSKRKLIRNKNGKVTKIRFGETKNYLSPNSDGLTATPTRSEITIFEGSIGIIANQSTQLSGQLGVQQQVGKIGMIGATGSHESVHSTSLVNINRRYANQTRGTNFDVETAAEAAEFLYNTQFLTQQ